jgi:hypothetical protein
LHRKINECLIDEKRSLTSLKTRLFSGSKQPVGPAERRMGELNTFYGIEAIQENSKFWRLLEYPSIRIDFEIQ